jgi:hypothetical protein
MPRALTAVGRIESAARPGQSLACLPDVRQAGDGAGFGGWQLAETCGGEASS